MLIVIGDASFAGFRTELGPPCCSIVGILSNQPGTHSAGIVGLDPWSSYVTPAVQIRQNCL